MSISNSRKSFEDFLKRAKEAYSKIKAECVKNAIIIHHDDADGLCSGAITKAMLEREGYRVKMLCLEKVYPEVIKSIHAEEGRIIFYADIGSSHADLISEFNEGKNLTIILDHHDPVEAKDERVIDLNLERFGYKGERDFSGASCCYLFSKVMNEGNKDLAYMAITGSYEIPEGFMTLNKEILEEAKREGIIEVSGKKLIIKKLGIDVRELFSALQILGSVGYYSGGPELGIRACFEGLTSEISEELRKLEHKRATSNKKLLAILYKKRLNETEHIQWFDSMGLYSGMGTKVIGTFCSYLSYQARLIKPDKYIFGYIEVPTEIPGWGHLPEKLVKVSVRVPRKLRKMIEEGKMPGAVNLLREATKEYGVADGHEFAASAVIPAKFKERLIEEAEEALKRFLGKLS